MKSSLDFILFACNNNFCRIKLRSLSIGMFIIFGCGTDTEKAVADFNYSSVLFIDNINRIKFVCLYILCVLIGFLLCNSRANT